MVDHPIEEPVERRLSDAFVGHHHADDHVLSDVGPTDHEGTFFHQSVANFSVQFIVVDSVILGDVSETNVGPHPM